MKLWAVFRKSLREQLRQFWLLSLVVSMAPFFVVLMYLVFGAGTYSYKVVALNHDRGVTLPDGTQYQGGAELVAALAAAQTVAGSSALRVTTSDDRERAEQMLMNGKAHALVEVPEGFSEAIAAAREGRETSAPKLVYMGDLASSSYLVAAVLAITAASEYVEAATGRKGPVTFVEEPLGGSGARSELDLAIPGLLVLALIMLIFPVAMALAREAENGCLRRLQLTRLSAFDILGGLSLVQVLVGMVAVLAAFATALAVGFRSQGPVWAAVAISIVATFSIIGVGLLVACFSRSVTEAFLLGNFPMILLMFFSGAMIPMPKTPLFSVGSVTVGLWDWLPTTHAVSAMNKVLGLGLGMGEVLYELSALVVLSAAYFLVGVWLFRRRRMRAA